MSCTRRTMLLAGLGLLMGGCQTQTSRVRSQPFWPSTPASSGAPSGATARGLVPQRYDRSALVPTPPAARPAPAAAPGFQAIPRAQWTTSNPILSKINPMNGISRITVHHEGSSAVWFSDASTTASRLELIRKVHTGADHGWGDIGYHYIVDRAGRVWEGRPIIYQGAHVRDQNEHNIGIMVLGNFQSQTPSEAQLGTLAASLRTLRSQYRVSLGEIYTHRELNPTACPGRYLQPSVDVIRTRYL